MERYQKKRRTYLSVASTLLAAAIVVALLITVLLSLYYFGGDRLSGARLLTVPDLTGLHFSEVTLPDAELYQIVIRERYADAPAGTVLSQDPPKDSVRKAVPERHYVTLTLTVSKGPQLARIPFVVGLPEETARTKLLTAGLSPAVKAEYAPRPRGEVIAVDPPADTELKRGSAVTLTVSRGPRFPRVPVPDLTGLSAVEARSLLEASGLSVGKILYRTSYSPPERVLAQSVLPALSLPRGASVDLTVSRSPEEIPETEPETEGEETDPPTEPETERVPSPEELIDRILGTIFPKNPT